MRTHVLTQPWLCLSPVMLGSISGPTGAFQRSCPALVLPHTLLWLGLVGLFTSVGGCEAGLTLALMLYKAHGGAPDVPKPAVTQMVSPVLA